MGGYYYNENSEDCIGESDLIVTNDGVSNGTSGNFYGGAITDCPGGLDTDNPKRIFLVETADGTDSFGPYDASTPIPANLVLTVIPFVGLTITLAGDYLNPILSVTTGFPQTLTVRSVLYASDQCGSFKSVSAKINLGWKIPLAGFDITQVLDGEHSFTDTSDDCGCPGGINTWAWTGYDADGVTVLWTSSVMNPPNYTYLLVNTYYLVELTITTDCGESFTFKKFVFWPSAPPVAGISIDDTDCRAMILETTGSLDGLGNSIENDLSAFYTMDWYDSTNNRFIATITGFPFGAISFDWTSSTLNLLSAANQTDIEAAFTGEFGTSGFGNSIIMNKEDIFDVLLDAGECTIDAIEFSFFLTVQYDTKSSANYPSILAPICCEAGSHNIPLFLDHFDPSGNMLLGESSGRIFTMVSLPRAGCSDCGFKKNIAGDPSDDTGDVPATPASGQVSGDLFRPNVNICTALTADNESTPYNHPVMGNVYQAFGMNRGNDYPLRFTPNMAVSDWVDWRKNWLVERIDILGNLPTTGDVRPNIQIIPGIRSNGEPVFVLFNTANAGMAELRVVYYDGAAWIPTIVYSAPARKIYAIHWAADNSGIYFAYGDVSPTVPPQVVALHQFAGTFDIAGLTNPANYTYREINQFAGIIGNNDISMGITNIGTSSNGLPIIYFAKTVDANAIYKAVYNGGATLTQADWVKTVVYTRPVGICSGLSYDGTDMYLNTRFTIEQLDISVEPFTLIKDYSGDGTLGEQESKKF